MPLLTIVYPLRNLEAQRIYNCLHSLRLQTFKDFHVIISDYGSNQKGRSHLEKALKKIGTKLNFEVIRTEIKGDWNRSAALNRGIIKAKTQFIMGSDLDMIYHPDFLSIATQNLNSQSYVVHHIARQLKKMELPSLEIKMRENNWEFFHSNSKSRTGGGTGACQIIPRSKFFYLGGYDEIYEHWGAEDDDMRYRLRQVNMKEVSISNLTNFYHQWHPTNKKNRIKINANRNYFATSKTPNFSVIRNGGSWDIDEK